MIESTAIEVIPAACCSEARNALSIRREAARSRASARTTAIVPRAAPIPSETRTGRHEGPVTPTRASTSTATRERTASTATVMAPRPSLEARGSPAPGWRVSGTTEVTAPAGRAQASSTSEDAEVDVAARVLLHVGEELVQLPHRGIRVPVQRGIVHEQA